PTLDLGARHLEYAYYSGADLRKVKFDGAYLQNACFGGETLLQGASLHGAQLQGASLYGGDLQGADLQQAQLQGADLQRTQLQGASLDFAELQGASLQDAKLQGASLKFAELQGASFRDAQLQGADLFGAELLGASLEGAQLNGTSFVFTQLQGASLEKAKFAGALLYDVSVWRAHISPELIGATTHFNVHWDNRHVTLVPKPQLSTEASNLWTAASDEWSEASYLALRKVIEEKVPVAPRLRMAELIIEGWESFVTEKLPRPDAAGREAALKRIEILDPNKPFDAEAQVPGWRRKIKNAEYTEFKDKWRKALAGELKALVCSGEGYSIYIVHGLMKNDWGDKPNRIVETGAQAPGLVEAILKPDCPVSTALTEQDKANLKKLAKEAQSSESKP
ncbi:MAG: pentapeptide repeat-containing protein, partial [Candidatus Angelobacter sp.]